MHKVKARTIRSLLAYLTVSQGIDATTQIDSSDLTISSEFVLFGFKISWTDVLVVWKFVPSRRRSVGWTRS